MDVMENRKWKLGDLTQSKTELVNLVQTAPALDVIEDLITGLVISRRQNSLENLQM